MQIKCPQCDFTREVPEEKIPSRSEVATCPKCGVKFRFRALDLEDFNFEAPTSESQPRTGSPEEQHAARHGHAGQDSGFYGPDGRLHEHPESLRPHPESTSKEDDATVLPPFEDLEHFGFFPGIAESVKRAMLRPRLFFSVMPLSGLARPLVFALLLFEFYMILSLFWDMTGLPAFSSLGIGSGSQMAMLDSDVQSGPMDPVSLFVVMPIMFIINLFLTTGILHGVLVLLRAAPRGFEATFRAMAYSYAPLVLSIVPYGYLAGWIWSLGITVVGCAAIHRTPTWRVALGLGLVAGVVAILYFSALSMPHPAPSGAPQP